MKNHPCPFSCSSGLSEKLLASPMSTFQFSGIWMIEQFELLLFEENLASAAQPTKPKIVFLIRPENSVIF